MPFVAQKERRFLEAHRRDGNEGAYFESIREGLRRKELTPEDFSLRDLFEEFVPDGREAIRTFDPRRGGGAPGMGGSSLQLLESGINTGHFANITGQILYTTVIEAFNDPIFIAPRLARTIPTPFDGEKIPGIGRLGNQNQAIPPGDPYPRAGVGEEWIRTQSTQKRGVIVDVLKEEVFFDRTGLVLERAGEVSRGMAINKEIRVIDAALGVTSHYSRNDSALIATYGDNSGTHNWDNLAASNDLEDYSDIDNALQLFDGLTDPNTGEPIVVTPNALIIPRSILMATQSVLRTTEIRTVTNTSTTSIANNPLAGMQFDILTNQYVQSRMTAGSLSAGTWWIGDFMRAFAYMENWPITTDQAPPNAPAEFERDVVAQYKVSERGVVAVREPRYAVKCTPA